MNSVFITIGILFHVFSFSQKMDDKGDLIPIDDRLTETTVRYVLCLLSSRTRRVDADASYIH